jgi:hypothetical protein
MPLLLVPAATVSCSLDKDRRFHRRVTARQGHSACPAKPTSQQPDIAEIEEARVSRESVLEALRQEAQWATCERQRETS